MDTKKKYAIGLTSIVLAGTLALGSVASAAGNDDTGGGRRGNRPRLTAEQKCEYQEQIAERVATLQQRIADRLIELDSKRATADDAGDTELVAKLDTRIERLQTAQERVDARFAKFQTWVASNC
jgi:hypothetical protein